MAVVETILKSERGDILIIGADDSIYHEIYALLPTQARQLAEFSKYIQNGRFETKTVRVRATDDMSYSKGESPFQIYLLKTNEHIEKEYVQPALGVKGVKVVRMY